ncbi:MAG: hypothetical protein ABJD66_11645 [Cellulophaga sp.]|uniref:hypothetical protein n=1 Tax=Cellulophaga sp. TaxID=1972202 RepID=UPI003265632C
MMKNNDNKKWLFILAITLIAFTILIPIKIYTQYPYLISILGGILSGISIQKILFSKFKDEKPGCIYIITPPISIGIIILLVLTFNYRKERRLASNGKIAEGKIISKLSLESRKGEINDLTIQFTTPHNKTIQFTQDVSKDILTSFNSNDKISIVYDPENPIIAQSLHNNEIVKAYTNRKNECLPFKNLISFSKRPKTIKKEITNFGIWTNQTLIEEKGIWVNIPNQETLISNGKYILYKTKSTHLFVLQKGIKENQFKEVNNIDNLEIKDIVNEILPIKGKNYIFQNEKQILILNEESKLRSHLTHSLSMPELHYTIKIMNKNSKSM